MSEAIGYYGNIRRSEALRVCGRHREALAYALRAIEVCPEAAGGYLELALVQKSLPELQSEALATMNRAVALNPDDSDFIGIKAYLLFCLDRKAEAIESADAALALDPRCHSALLAKAQLFTSTGSWAEVEPYARRMLERDPLDREPLNLLAQAVRELGRLKESFEIAKRALALNPENAGAHLNIGFEFLYRGDFHQAKAHFLECLQREPSCHFAHSGLQEALLGIKPREPG